MLKLIRKRLKVILWTIIISFVLWGVGSALSARQGGSVYAGTLYGRPVTVQALRAALEASRHRAILTYGERAMEFLPPSELQRQAWDWLLFLTAARRARIRVSDRDVIEELGRWPLFQQDGRFDPRAYQLIVRYSLGTTPRAFEEEVRGQLAITKLLNRAAGAVQVTDEELESAYRLEAEAVRLAYLLVEPERYAAQVTVSQAEVRAHYEAHAAAFQSEPKVQVRYLAITPEQVRDQVRVGEADILEAYLRQAPPEQHGTPPSPERREELRRELHSARARDRAADLAWELQARWKQQPDLATLGQPHRLIPQETAPFAFHEPIADVASSDALAQAAFELKPGEISRVIDTPEAFYLLTLINTYPARPLPLAEAEPKIQKTLQERATRRRAQEAAHNLLATIQELAMAGAPDPLTPAAAKMGLTVAKTDWVTRASPLGEAGSVGALLGSAFGLEVGQVGGPWQTSRGWVIAQLLERRPINPEQFAQAKEQLRQQLTQRKRATTLDAWLRKLRSDAKPTPNPS